MVHKINKISFRGIFHMNNKEPKFEILIDDTLLSFDQQDSDNKKNKYVLSLVNDFESTKWRYQKFHDFVWDNIKETALSEKERNNLIGQPASTLRKSALNLRIIQRNETAKEPSPTEGSEIAEILLYGFLRNKYNALPVVPKIFNKQNVNDNAKGADSVHIVVNDDKSDFSLWLGEAKFFNNIDNARFKEIIASIQSTLTEEKLRKENSILTGLTDLDLLISPNERLTAPLNQKIKQLLSNDTSLDCIKPKLHVPIFLLHECNITKQQQYLDETYKQKIMDRHKERAIKYFKKHFDTLNNIPLYSSITFHLILFPVPDKQKILDRFIKKAHDLREEEQ